MLPRERKCNVDDDDDSHLDLLDHIIAMDEDGQLSNEEVGVPP